jgi:hypothetical protein
MVFLLWVGALGVGGEKNRRLTQTATRRIALASHACFAHESPTDIGISGLHTLPTPKFSSRSGLTLAVLPTTKSGSDYDLIFPQHISAYNHSV